MYIGVATSRHVIEGYITAQWIMMINCMINCMIYLQFRECESLHIMDYIICEL